MAVKRLINKKQKEKLKDFKKYKGKKILDLTALEKGNLLELIAKKLNLL